jgi:signal transduction histidine kinase/response regulator RpfG family c-di-GMP phosphodiesterase
MTTAITDIFSGAGGSIAYVFSMVILGGLVVVSLFAAKRMLRPLDLRLLIFAVMAYIVSRLMVASPEGALRNLSSPALLAFCILNLMSFSLLAVFALRGRDSVVRKGGSQSRDASQEHALRRLAVSSAYFGLFGAAGYIMIKAGNISSFSMTALLNFVCLGASVRVIAFAYAHLRLIPHGIKKPLLVVLSMMALAWALLEATYLAGAEGSLRIFRAGRLADGIVLIGMVWGLLSIYLRMGMAFKNEAEKNRNKIESAEAELAKVSKLASHIHEDNTELIDRQKKQTFLFMKKVESLENILQIGITIQKRKKLNDLLQMIVELVRDNLGFKTITLRLFNQKTQSFETKAYVGLSEEVRDTVVSYRIPRTEYQKMIEPRFRISRSYFLRNSAVWYGEELDNGGSVVENTWGEIDMLIVPLHGETGDTIGYLSVENPESPNLSVGDVIENLENIADLAVIAIRNADFLRELELKNEKLRSYAEKLSSLNKLKSNFVATISHEFRTPLTSIKAYCNTLLENADKVERDLLREFLIVIDEESTRLMSLIEDILDFSQTESGAIKFERSPCNINEIVEQATSELEKNFESRQIQLHTELPENNVLVRVERDLMRQLLVNLLHNASKFTKENSNVWLRIEDDTVSIRITVEDEGIGIPDEHMDKIFDHFHQVDNSDTREFGGSGLGLAICKNIVDWHEGKIWVENVVGKGARFVAVIPKKQVVVQCHVLNISSTVRRFEIERFLELLVENVAEFLNAKKASIMLIDTEHNELRIEGAIGLDEEIVEHSRVKIGEGIAGRVAEEGRSMFVGDIEKDKRISRANNERLYESKSFVSVPIKRNDSVIGVVNVASPLSGKEFNVKDSRLLEFCAERIGAALEKLERFAEASISYEQTRETLKAILDSRRYIDIQHEEMITELVMKSAERLGLSEEQVLTLRYILNVYDLGLVKVGYHIIKKPIELSKKDREEIEKHTILGNEMLEAIESLPKVKDVVLYHHENYDGTGYPGKLKGDSIPVEARVIRVADSFRALISHRPYQKQYTIEEAKDILKQRAGETFDPQIVRAFIGSLDEWLIQKNETSDDRTVGAKSEINEPAS